MSTAPDFLARHSHSRPFQYRLRDLFVLMLAVAVSCALFRMQIALGMVVACATLCITAARAKIQHRTNVAMIFGSACVVAASFSLAGFIPLSAPRSEEDALVRMVLLELAK